MKRPFLTLGTVQFGHPYGLRKNGPLLTTQEVQGILRQAVNAGIRHFDTAHAYGLAERRLGEARALGILPADSLVLTKLPPELEASQVEASVREALANLRQERLDVLMLHRWEQRENGALWDTLRSLRDTGVIGALGASVYNPAEACAAARDPDVTHLQIPLNLLDWRWETSELPSIKAQRPDLTIYVRSIYLQGILVSPSSTWPSIPGVNAADYVAHLEALAQQVGADSRQSLCFGYAQAQAWVDSLVIGVDTAQQLVENIRLHRNTPLDAVRLGQVRETFPAAPEQLLNPSLWTTANLAKEK
jgi:aryl-alcohol dehydrogenase-like predicted oxidoreductase